MEDAGDAGCGSVSAGMVGRARGGIVMEMSEVIARQMAVMKKKTWLPRMCTGEVLTADAFAKYQASQPTKSGK